MMTSNKRQLCEKDTSELLDQLRGERNLADGAELGHRAQPDFGVGEGRVVEVVQPAHRRLVCRSDTRHTQGEVNSSALETDFELTFCAEVFCSEDNIRTPQYEGNFIPAVPN